MAAQVLPTPPLQYHPNHMNFGGDMLNPFSRMDNQVLFIASC